MMQFRILSAELFGVAISQMFYRKPKWFGIRTGLKWSPVGINPFSLLVKS